MFLFFLAVFSKRTLWAKSAAAKECPRIHALKTPPKPSLFNRKKPGVYLEVQEADLLVGFTADFVVLAGGFRAGRVPADFLFSAGRFSRGFFRGILLCIL